MNYTISSLVQNFSIVFKKRDAFSKLHVRGINGVCCAGASDSAALAEPHIPPAAVQYPGPTADAQQPAAAPRRYESILNPRKCGFSFSVTCALRI